MKNPVSLTAFILPALGDVEATLAERAASGEQPFPLVQRRPVPDGRYRFVAAACQVEPFAAEILSARAAFARKNAARKAAAR